ncbi:MAG: hypothetical protein IPM82_26070 [Saprospiraceae bacterium]|nr:hypothetical protein [Saprospiraceae bacterium]
MDASTGPTGIATDPLASFGVPASAAFSPSILIKADHNYFLLISNVQDNGIGFDLTVGGTATISLRIPPSTGMIEGPTEICAGGVATFSIPLILGADNYAFQVLPGGITQNGSQPSHALSFPTEGTFEVCAWASGPQLGCFATEPSCMTVNVTQLPVPAGYESGYVCTNDYYVAGNGDVFYYGGVFDLVYDSWQGCDSIVRLSLTQKISDFYVTV